MATEAKTLAQMDKHLTQQEIQARQEAEAGVIPDRGGHVRLEKPHLMTGDVRAKKYWETIMERMEGYVILDDLDSETLGIHCVMLSRYDALVAEIRAARKKLKKIEGDPDALTDAMNALAGLTGKAQKLETTILQYADKLGLTPSGRVKLAQKRAEQAAQADPDADLYGD